MSSRVVVDDLLAGLLCVVGPVGSSSLFSLSCLPEETGADL